MDIGKMSIKSHGLGLAGRDIVMGSKYFFQHL
jgi:hypothetical protein